MNTISGRHMFWQSPTSRGVLRTTPFRMGGRQVQMGGGIFMGEAPTNRLDAVSIPAIFSRIQLAPGLAASYPWVVNNPASIPDFRPITPAEAQILIEVSKNPTDEELKDVALIDNLFNRAFYRTDSTSHKLCSRNVPGLGGKFWCPDQGPSFLSYVPLFGPSTSFAAMFGIDVNKTWGEEKFATRNGLMMLKEKVAFPLPPPLDLSPDYVWSLAAGPHIAEMAHVGGAIDPEVFRTWYAMAVLASYDTAADYIIEVQKKKAKKAKRKALIAGIAIVVAGIVLSFIVPGILLAAISTIKAAYDYYIQAKDRVKAAKALAEAARMFEADASAFAAILQKAADMMDSEAAQEVANAPLTPEQIAAIKEVKDNPDPGATPSTGSMIVGGVAATGIVATLIALLK